MNVLRGRKFIEVRLDPLSKANRAKRILSSKDTGTNGDPRKFVRKILEEKDRMFSEQMIERRGSIDSCLNLEYIFWRIRNDKYVK